MYDDCWSARRRDKHGPRGRENMDLYRIIGDLVAERNRLQRIIESLEGMDAADVKPTRQRPAARGRKSMDREARKAVSERMKLYWARRRGETGPESRA